MMNYRNAKRLADGRIDCEIEHPMYGWIPFTSASNDVGAQFDAPALYAAMDADPATAPYVPPTEADIAAAAEVQLQAERAAMRLSFAQLLIGLVTEQWITEADGEMWLSGGLPAVVAGAIAGLPVEARFAARARALRPAEVLRADPLVNMLAALQGVTPEALDTFFTTYSQV